jgi:hypothetical protein
MILVVGICVAATAATLAAWWYLPRRHRSVWTVFIAYLCVLPVFAAIYDDLHRRDPDAFAFASPVAEARAFEVDRSVFAAIGRLTSADNELQRLIMSLKSVTSISVSTSSAGDITVETPHYVVYASPFHSIASADFPITRLRVHDKNHRRKTEEMFIPSVEPDDVIVGVPQSVETPSDERGAAISYAIATTALQRFTKQRAQYTKRLHRPLNQRQDQWEYADFLYFSVITQATIGYGDIIPNSRSARMVVMVHVLLSVALLTAILAYAAAFIRVPRAPSDSGST